jgi:hypothetical protein
VQHLTIKQIVTIGNLADGGVRRVLYEAFDYERNLAQEERIRASEGVEDKAVYELLERRGFRIETFAEDRIRYFEQDLSEDFFPQLRDTRPSKAQKLAYLAVKLRYYSRANEVPRALLDVIAPKFFEMYPEGEIWFVELDESTLRKLWADEDTLQAPGAFGSPHEMSGLEGGVSTYIWLHLMMHFFYPLVNGFISSQDARRSFLFLPDRSMSTIEEYRFDLYKQTQFDLVSIYGDSAELFGTRSIKSSFPIQFANLSDMKSYFEWYIVRCSALLEQLISIVEVKQRFVSNLTLNRIAVETELIETSESPYLMKLLFYGVLDKYANLYKQLGLETNKEKEVKVWKTLLIRDFYETEIQEAVKSIPGRVGEVLSHYAEWIFNYLEDEAPSPEVIREFRNSNHGYSIRNVDRLLEDSGELHNDVPFLATLLWHWLLIKGLPKNPISRLYENA